MLRVMGDLDRPASTPELAEALELHPNTIRGHMVILEEAGLVQRSTEERQTPGRPRALYSVTGPTDEGPEGYRFLAEILTTSLQLGTEDPGTAAEAAGQAWGRYLTEPARPGELPGPAEATERLVGMLADMGFEPDPAGTEESTVIDLHDCPFRELAREHSDVVCGIHRGLLKGTMEMLGGTATVESLEPFVGPSLCRTTVRTRHRG